MKITKIQDLKISKFISNKKELPLFLIEHFGYTMG